MFRLVARTSLTSLQLFPLPHTKSLNALKKLPLFATNPRLLNESIAL